MLYYKCNNLCTVVLSCNHKGCVEYKPELLDLKPLPKSKSQSFNMKKYENKIIYNNHSKIIYNKQLSYV
jgi:hypothetical protein